MKNLNLEVAVDSTRAYTEEQFTDLIVEIDRNVVFTMSSCEGDEGYVIKNAPDEYLVWFVGSTYRNVGEDRVVDQFHVTAVSAHYSPHAALNHMCLQMQIDTETLEEAALAERQGV